jgi:hypothetical protein
MPAIKQLAALLELGLGCLSLVEQGIFQLAQVLDAGEQRRAVLGERRAVRVDLADYCRHGVSPAP